MVSLPYLDCIITYSVLFYFSVMVHFLCYCIICCVIVQFSVLLYSSVLLCCSLLFILLCSSSCYVCVVVCIYCTLTLPPGVNPITVNKYLSIHLLPPVERL
jgi:hypothetical protein